jgi:hypothetical protein
MEDELSPDQPREQVDESAGVPAAPAPPAPAAPPAVPAPPAPPARSAVPVTPTSAKRKLDVLFVLLGFFTPMVVNFVAGGLLAAVGSVLSDTDPGPVILGGFAAVPLLLLSAFLVLFLVGRSRNNERMRSFGLGGLLSYAVGALLTLLVWGTCFLGAGMAGLGS